MLRRDQIAIRDAILGKTDSKADQRVRTLFTGDGNHARSLIALHRHHFLTTMTEALAANYPVVERLVSSESFAVLARAFIPIHPPTTSRLFIYGQEFPDFLSNFDGVDPYLVDIARLEQACNKAAHSTSDSPLQPEDLQSKKDDALSALRLSLHPSITLLSSPYALFEIWTAHQQDDVGSPPLHAKDGQQYLAIGRRANRVELLCCNQEVFLFLEALNQGKTLKDAAHHARLMVPDFTIVESFAFLLKHGVFAALSTSPSSPKI